MDVLSYHSIERSPLSRRLLAGAAIVAGVALVVAAAYALSLASPGPGERAYAPQRVAAARSAALALWAAGHAVLLGLAMPLVYRPRRAYLAIAVAAAVVGALAGVAAAALVASIR